MSGVTVTDDIEFLDHVVAPNDADSESVRTSSSLPRWFGVLAVLAGCIWFVTSTGADEPEPFVDESVVNEPVPSQPEAPELAGPDAAEPIEPPTPPDFGQWPNPPTDRDPYVVRIPGPGERPSDLEVSSLEGVSIVYVNSAGDPTVVSFDSGDVFEVDVAAIRVHETFAVENGQVVSLEGVNPALDDATPDAVVFHTYRDVDAPGVGTMSDTQGIGRGPELCLSDRTCTRPGLGVDRMTRPGLVVERFDSTTHWSIDDLFERWVPEDRWLLSSDGYRIPAPVGVIWVIGPPDGGASWNSGSSSGVI